jgi:hypothetical protein
VQRTKPGGLLHYAPYISSSQSVQSHVVVTSLSNIVIQPVHDPHKTMHRLCYTCMQHVCKIVLASFDDDVSIPGSYTMHNTSRESRKGSLPVDHNPRNDATFFSSVFCLAFVCLCDCLDYICLMISFLVTFPLKESVRQLCVACKVSLYVYILLVALLKNYLYSRGIVTDGHHNISIRVSSSIKQAVFIRYIAFRTLKDSLPDRDGIRTHGIFAFLRLIIVDFFEVWNPATLQVCNTILLYM